VTTGSLIQIKVEHAVACFESTAVFHAVRHHWRAGPLGSPARWPFFMVTQSDKEVVAGTVPARAVGPAATLLSTSRRLKFYGRGLSNCLVHLIGGHEDDYFTRYKAASVSDN
jgi:hypothetical protein